MIALEGKVAEAKEVFSIPAGNLAKVQDRILALNKRAAKLGCQPIVLTISDPIRVEVKVPVLDGRGRHVLNAATRLPEFTKEVRVHHEVTFKGEAPKFAGWSLVAALQYVAGNGENDAAMLIRSVPGETLPESFRTAESRCDHCGLVRRRTETFVVRHEDETYKQVGRQCIADFLGHRDPDAILAGAEFLFSAMDILGEGEDWGAGGGQRVVWLKDYLAYVAMVCRTEGWLSRSKARELEEQAAGIGGAIHTPTADRAYSYMFPFKRTGDEPVPEAEDAEIAEKAIDWLRGTLAAQADLNDYQHNLVVVCTRDAVVEKGFGIAASLIPAYKREMGLVAERKARFDSESKSEYFGTVGKREVFKLTVLKVIDCESQFGASHLHKFVDEKGNIATWFSSARSLEIGKTYEIKARVKSHEVYKGVKQTMLTRCAPECEWQCWVCLAYCDQEQVECPMGHRKVAWVCALYHRNFDAKVKICSECGLKKGQKAASQEQMKRFCDLIPKVASGLATDEEREEALRFVADHPEVRKQAAYEGVIETLLKKAVQE